MINELRFQTINKWQMTNDKLTNGQSLFTNDKAVLKFHILLSNCAVILIDVVFPKIYFLVGNITTKNVPIVVEKQFINKHSIGSKVLIFCVSKLKRSGHDFLRFGFFLKIRWSLSFI